jgi:hypothetical protein
MVKRALEMPGFIKPQAATLAASLRRLLWSEA